jgi:putative flippase GtrA
MDGAEARMGAVPALIQRRGVRQFVKFCIVGASSTLIDFGIFYLLIEIVHIHSLVGHPDLARALAVCAGFLVAVTNGFFWNSRWTFRKAEAEGQGKRYLRFVFTNAIGLALNLMVTLLVARIVPAPLLVPLAKVLKKDPAGFVGKGVATLFVLFWNFTASKYWTFRH